MVAELMPAPQVTDEDVIDLDALTADELLLEQATVRAELVKIEAQLADPTREDRLGAGEYRIWRRNALLAHAHFNRERLEIHALLQIKGPEMRRARQEQRRAAGLARMEQQQAEAAERKAKVLPPTPTPPSKKEPSPEYLARLQEHAEKRAAVRAAMQEDGNLDGLLLRLALVIRDLVGDADELPDTVTNDGKAALGEMRRYLRATFGQAAVKAMFAGSLDGGAS